MKLTPSAIHRVIVPRYNDAPVFGLPSNAVTISNSERSTSHCLTRWFYQYGQGCSPESSPVMDFGTAYHSVIQNAREFWKASGNKEYDFSFLHYCWNCIVETKSDCPHCQGTGAGPLPLIRLEWEARMSQDEEYSDESLDDRMERLRLVCEGYFRFFGKTPTLNILFTEISIAMPITNSEGKIYKSEVPLFQLDEKTWRFARPGDIGRIENVVLPWYYLVKMDGVGQDQNGNLWVLEEKTAKAPANLLRGLGVDPQTTGYATALEWAVQNGLLMLENANVAGHCFTVANSTRHQEPKVLKGGGVSKDKRQNIPSWMWNDWFSNKGISQTPEDTEFAEHLLQTVDQKLYQYEWSSISRYERMRFKSEIYGVAQKLSQARRDARYIEHDLHMAEKFPRSPVCKFSGCSFRGTCMAGQILPSDIPQTRGQQFCTK